MGRLGGSGRVGGRKSRTSKPKNIASRRPLARLGSRGSWQGLRVHRRPPFEITAVNQEETNGALHRSGKQHDLRTAQGCFHELGAMRSQRHTNTEFAHALRHRIGCHAKDPRDGSMAARIPITSSAAVAMRAGRRAMAFSCSIRRAALAWDRRLRRAERVRDKRTPTRIAARQQPRHRWADRGSRYRTAA